MLKNALQIISRRFNDLLQSKGQIQKWPTRGRMGYITLVVWGVPNASKRGTKSQVAHQWAHGPNGYMHAFFVFVFRQTENLLFAVSCAKKS